MTEEKRFRYLADNMVRELADALADVVVRAQPFDERTDESILTYLSGTGAIHKAIKVLAEYGVHARPGGVDSRDMAHVKEDR